MINDIIQLWILCVSVGLIILYLLVRINIDDANFTKNSMIAFALTFSALAVITYKYAGYYKVLIICMIIILLNYICFKRKILISIINSILVYVIFCIGDISSGIILMNIPNIDIVAIQSNSFLSFLVNVLVFVNVNIVMLFMKITIKKIKIIKMDKETLIPVAVISLLIGLILFLGPKAYEHILLNSENIDTKYINILMISSLLLLFSVILTVLILVNKYIGNKNKIKEIIESSKLDKMTDALNREAGLNLLKNSIEERKENNNFITICYIDINNLKKVNDNYGHMEGDNLIKKVSKVIKTNLRKTDAVSRLGGDEFLVVFLDCRINAAQEILNRIDLKLKELSKKSKYEISISYGFCEIEPRSCTSVENIIETADKEMYKLKRQLKENFIEV